MTPSDPETQCNEEGKFHVSMGIMPEDFWRISAMLRARMLTDDPEGY